jgi:3-phosphoinositide dependent protein kinase-1
MDLLKDPLKDNLPNGSNENTNQESPSNNRQIKIEPNTHNIFDSKISQLENEKNGNHRDIIENNSSKISPISPNKKPNIKDFEILQDLGRGAYAKVCLARYIHNNKMIAIKILDKSFMNKHQKSQEALVEREILTICDHHSIIKLLSTFHDKRKLYFVLEYAPNKDLASFMRSQGILSYETAQFFAAQVLNVLIYLHQKNIAHRDLKPENIVLDSEMHIKLVSERCLILYFIGRFFYCSN